LIAHLEKVIPNIGELGQLTSQLRRQVGKANGLVLTESIQPPILLRMKF